MMQCHTEFQSEHIPYGYLITFRAYGTWLHGRPGSVDRFHNAFKANTTRMLREAGYWRSERSPWVRKGSKRYLWTEQDLVNAIAYVLYDQGEPLP
ncbi:MAG TPA: hypothetical protein VGJ48_18145 [Pyrinomonadaceae bacterium]